MDAFTEMNLSDSEMNKIFGGETVTYEVINEDGSITIVTVES
jgi:hypothetical protein